MVTRLSLALSISLLAVFLLGCSSSEITHALSVEERFAAAKKLFDDGDYLQAVDGFTVITLQYQGSAFAADAQYYLGECRFERGEFLLASFEYSVVKRNYPASPRVADAQYKTALAYYNLAPKASLDQQYTKRAIDEFQSFLEYYPAHEKAVEADARIKELTGRLAKKAYENAIQYVKMGYFRASIFYFDDVIENYHDTEFAPLAIVEKTELLISRSKYMEAHAEISRFIERYPTSVLRGRINELKEKVDKVMPPGYKSVGSETNQRNTTWGG
jgi:outer membrane protein assembly factor BamD